MILRAAEQNMTLKGAVVLYINAETTPDIGELIAEIVKAALDRGLKMTALASLDSSVDENQQIARLVGTLNVLDKAAGTSRKAGQLCSSSMNFRR